MYISNFCDLTDFCKRANQSKVLAVDTEFLRERTYYPQLCLVQLATPEETAAVDPLLIQDLSPLKALFEDSSITKVFHACSQDMEVIGHTLGSIPAPVFDTQVVAAFLGHRMQLGYGALVQDYCHVHLPKTEALTDWSQRPLDPEQLKYAEDDVRYLPSIYETMVSQLVEKDRLSWIKPELQKLAEPSQYQRNPRDAYLHLRRSASLTRKQLAVAREVCAWRETVAAQRDIPRKWVVSDEVVVEVSRHVPNTPHQLRRIRGTEKMTNGDCESLVEMAQRGLACRPANYPEVLHRVRPSAESESVIDLMSALLRIVSEKSGVASQLIASHDDLYDLLVDKPTPLTKGWRYELAGRQLEALLKGELGLTVKDSHIEIL